MHSVDTGQESNWNAHPLSIQAHQQIGHLSQYAKAHSFNSELMWACQRPPLHLWLWRSTAAKLNQLLLIDTFFPCTHQWIRPYQPGGHPVSNMILFMSVLIHYVLLLYLSQEQSDFFFFSKIFLGCLNACALDSLHSSCCFPWVSLSLQPNMSLSVWWIGSLIVEWMNEMSEWKKS